MPRINLDDENYAAEVLSYYLWGQKSAPSPSEITDNRWIDRTGGIILDVDPNQFLAKNGDLFNAKDFELAEVFFSGKDGAGNSLDLSLITSAITPNANGGYELTHGQFVELFFNKKKVTIKQYDDADKAQKSISLYRRSLGVFDGDYGKRSFVFGTVAVNLDRANVKYTLDKNLNPMYIKNFDLIINKDGDNFDFKGGEGSEFANEVLKKVADSSGIGKQVILDFGGGAKKSIPILAKHSFNALEDLDGIRDFSKFALEWKNIVSTGVVDYQDENGKLVVFGSNGNDSLQDAKIKLADLANSLNVGNHSAPNQEGQKLYPQKHY